MNTETLTAALRALKTDDYEWSFAFYSVQKSKDGIELEWNRCGMRGTRDWAETLRTAFLDKTLAEKQVAEYSPFLSDKETVAAIGKDEDVIREQVTDIVVNITNAVSYAPADFVSGKLPKIGGYGFYGEYVGDANKQVLFMRRGNPFIIGGQKTRVCTAAGDEVISCVNPILKFTAAVDFLLIGDICYFNSSAIEKDFELESRHIAIAEKRLATIADSGIVNEYDRLEATAMSLRNAKKFLGFDKEILEYIVRLGVVEREEYLSTYGITVDGEGRMDSYDPEQCELIIDLLCCRSVVDPLGRLSTGSNITPRQ